MSTELRSTRHNKHLLWGGALMLFMIAGVHAGEPDAKRSDDDWARFGSFEDMAESAEGLDWKKESARWLRAVDKVWERNGWDSEAQLHARNMVHDVAVVPPWDVAGRFKVMTESIRGRYDLSPDQTAQFQGALFREMGGMLMKHGGLIIDQTVEMLQTRAAHKPITSEQVARWTKESDELMRDARASADRMTQELRPTLRDDQKAVWDRDWSAFEQRWEVAEKMRSRWAQGKWDAAQWGLEEDPIQRGLMAGGDERVAVPELAPDQARSRRVATSPAKWLAHDPTTWIAYVRDRQRRCELSPGQLDSAGSVYAELFERATAYIETRATQLESVPVSDRSTHERYDPIRSIFEELHQRLDAMLTDRQRDQMER